MFMNVSDEFILQDEIVELNQRYVDFKEIWQQNLLYSNLLKTWALTSILHEKNEFQCFKTFQ